MIRLSEQEEEEEEASSGRTGLVNALSAALFQKEYGVGIWPGTRRWVRKGWGGGVRSST